DGGPALEAQITADRIKVVNTKAGGTLIYLSDDLNNTIRVIDENGIIHRLAGGGAFELKDGLSGTEANLSEPRGLAVDANGTVYIGRFTSGQTAVRKIQSRFPGYDNETLLVPSPEGGEVFQFSAEGRHLKTFHAFTGAELLAFAYDVSGRLTHITDAHKNVTEIRHGSSGAASALISPYGQALSLGTDSKGNLTEIILPDASRHAFTYNSLGLLATYSTPREKVYAFTYDSLGRLVEDEDPAGGFQTLSREDTALGVRTTVRTAMGRETRYTLRRPYDLSKEKTTVDPAGLVTRTVTSGDGRESTREPDGTESVVELGPEPQFAFQDMRRVATTLTLPSSLSMTTRASGWALLADSLDPLSLLAYMDITWINARRSISSYVDAQRTWTHLTPEGRRDTTRIDSLGRIVEHIVPGLEKTTYTYDSRGRLATQTQGTGGAARTTTYAYDTLGRLSAVEDPEGRAHLYAHDLAGRLIRETLPDGREVDYAYDADGNIAFILPPGRPSHAFAYNAVGLDTLYDPPSLGAGTWHTGTGYNLDRQRLIVHRPDGQAVAYRHDAAGRLDSILTPSGAYVFRYHPQTGQLDTLRSPQGIGLAYAHDGGLVTRETWSGEVAGSVSWAYDENFFARLQILNGTDTLKAQFDADGLPQKVGDLAFWFDRQNGRLLEVYLGDITDYLDYNGFGELKGHLAFSAVDTLFRSRYERDKLGRIARKTETVLGVTKVHEYVYDPAGRLREAVLDGVDTIRYAYDSNGNRLAKVHPLGVDSGHYDDQDRMLEFGGKQFTYNANGDLTAQIQGTDTTTFDYDAMGNLVAVELPDGTDIEYVIDGQNRRVGKKVNGVLRQGFLYQSQLAPVAELDSASAVVSRFVYGSKGHVPDYMIKGGTAYRIISDHLGSVRLVVNSETGRIVQRIEYDEFGVIVYDSNPGFQPFGFAGGMVDGATGMVRFGARDYDPEIGRWTTKDPIGFSGGINHYAYVENNPVNFIDPKGLDIWIEGPSGEGPLKEPNFHQSINVGDPNGNYDSYSYGVGDDGFPWAEVYKDWVKGGRIEAFKKTTPEEDRAFKAVMDQELKSGHRGIYGWDNYCRSYSQGAYDAAPGIPSTPPNRCSGGNKCGDSGK
ncbi:MAG TPA: RHS repeat-associated core domain-containing protein, partial [Fibrobacteria bacterium]|nr:RHS repeat-associated core domain-containing protein [Fibrobacteria bacterium]